MNVYMCNVSDRSPGRPEGSLFNSYYTVGVGKGVTPFSGLLFFTLFFFFFGVFGMTRPRIEPQSSTH